MNYMYFARLPSIGIIKTIILMIGTINGITLISSSKM